MRISWKRRDFLKQSAFAASSVIALPGLSGSVGQQSVQAAEPPANARQWTSFRNSPDNLGIAQTKLADKLKLLWSFTTPDGTASTAVIDAGRVYMGTLSGHLHCFELKTGAPVWTYQSVDVVEPNSFAPGFNAPAALDAQNIYLGDDQGIFHAVDRQTGKRVWQAETAGEIVGGAQVLDGKVYFGSHDSHLYCYEAKTGKKLWEVSTQGPVNATPCVAGKFTFTTGCDQPVMRVIDLEQGKQSAEIPLNSLLIASPAVMDNILYFGTGDGIVFALDWQNRKTLWEFSVPGREQQMQSSPAVTQEWVVLGSRDKNIYCLDRQTGKMQWSFPTRSKVDSSPVIAGDRVYVGSADRNLYALNLEDGKLAWKHQAKQAITASPAIADGCLVIGTDSSNGQILCFGE